jgi:hypothetical protein
MACNLLAHMGVSAMRTQLAVVQEATAQTDFTGELSHDRVAALQARPQKHFTDFYNQQVFIDKGQALVEFTMVLPLLILILVGGTSFALGIHHAHMITEAVQMPSLQKLAMGDNPNAASTAELATMINSATLKDSVFKGNYVDSVSVKGSGDPFTSIIIAKASHASLASFIPGFSIAVGQAINSSLLSTTGNGINRPLNTPWVPGGTLVAPPWGAVTAPVTP